VDEGLAVSTAVGCRTLSAFRAQAADPRVHHSVHADNANLEENRAENAE
jgi:hypothetical protein